MKKIIALTLVIIMMLAIVACGDETKPPIGTDAPDTQNGTQPQGGGDETEPKDTQPAGPEDYEPDPDALHSGAVGFGSDAGVVYFDNIKIINKSNNKKLYEFTFEDEALPESTLAVSVDGTWDKDAADWSVAADPIEVVEEGAEATNHAYAFNGDTNGSMLYFGSPDWNYYQYSIKFLPADENSLTEIYFLVKDEKNYYVLSLGEDGNTKADCYQVVDGVKTSAAFKVTATLTLDEWNAVGITVDREIINIYINGSCKYSLFDPDFVNNYYDYNGDIIPGSISICGYGAPGPDTHYYPVEESHVIHDGKGTWSNAVANIASMAFDMTNTTFYDCDEKLEYATTDAELIGIPGDGTFETSYVGAWIEEGVVLTHIRYAPRNDGTGTGRMTGGIFQASIDGVTWVDLHTIDSAPALDDYVTFKVEDTTEYFYVRYVGAKEFYGNISEIEIWGNPAE